MKISSRKNVYESIDILSQEMAKQYFKDNHDKLSKEVELELETAKSKKEQKDVDENNLEFFLKSFRGDKDNSSTSLNQKEKNNDKKSNKSSKTVTFHKDIKSQIPPPVNLKILDFNEIYKNNANLRSSSKSQSKKDLGKIKLTHSVSPSANKSFFKKASQINFKTNSNIKSFKDDNSTLKTSLINSSFANKNNDWEKKSIRSVNNTHHTLDKKGEIPKFDKKNEIASTKTYNVNRHFSNKKINSNGNNNNTNNYSNNNHIDKSKTVNNQNNFENKIRNNYTSNTFNNSNNDFRRSKGSIGAFNSNNNIIELNKSKSSINIINKDIKETDIDMDNRNKSNKSLKSFKSSNKSLNKSINSKNNSSKSINIIDSSSNSNSSDTSNSKNKSEHSNNLIKELSKDDENSDFSNLKSENLNNKKNNVSINKEKQSNVPTEESNSNNIRISSFSSSLSKPNISLQKISLKNFVIYRKKNKTPKEFYQHQILWLQRQKNANNSKKQKILAKEEKDFTYFPEINTLSEQIVIEKGDYIPLFKRAAEIQNMKNSRIILNERKKIQEIDDMIRKSNTFYVNQNLINEFYLTQIDWKNKIQKRNKELYNKKEEEKKNEEMKIKSYKIKMNKTSRKLAKKRLREYYTINNINISNSPSKKKEDKNKKNNQNQKQRNKYSSFERLYRDGQMKEKRRNDLIKSYFSTLFKPNINQSFTMSTMSRTNINISKIKDKKNEKLIKNSKKINNISKNLGKKSFSVIFEEINMPTKKASRNIKNNSINNNIGSTKSTRGSYNNNMKNVNSLGVDSLSGKILNTPIKEISPLPYKLCEIKEMDSAYCESSARNQEENKNKIINNNHKLDINLNNSKYIIKETNLSVDSNFVNEQKKEKEIENENENKIEKKLEKKEREIIKKDIPALVPIRRKSSAFRPYTLKEEDKNEILEIKPRRNQSRNNLINVNIDLKKKISTNTLQKRESKTNVIAKTAQKNPSAKNTPKNTPKNTTKNTPRNSNRNTPKISSSNSKETKKRKSNLNSQKDNKLNELLSSNSKLVLVANEANNNNNNNNLLIENSLLNDSGSFGHFQQSNILETFSNKDKKTNRKNTPKETNDFKIDKDEENNKEDDEKEKEEEEVIEESSSSSSSTGKKKKKKKKNKFKFNAYNNDNENIENLSYSFDELSSLREENSWIKKIGMIEMKRYKERKDKEKEKEKEKINIYKNINFNNNEDDKNDKINLYMLNFRDVTSNAVKEPFTITDKKGIFFDFFKKKA